MPHSSNHQIEVEQLIDYDIVDATQLGALMPHLDESFTGQPIDEDHLRFLIESPHHDQLVARYAGEIVGAATMNIIAGAGRGRAGQLEDFVVSPEHRGIGVADELWQEMSAWCVRNQLSGFELLTETHRTAAVRFYERKGAQLVPGTDTHYTVAVQP